MKIIIISQEGTILQSNDGSIDELTSKSVVDAVLAAKNMAAISGDEFKYIKMEFEDEAIVAGLEEENIVAIFTSTPVEVVEAISRFNKSE